MYWNYLLISLYIGHIFPTFQNKAKCNCLAPGFFPSLLGIHFYLSFLISASIKLVIFIISSVSLAADNPPLCVSHAGLTSDLRLTRNCNLGSYNRVALWEILDTVTGRTYFIFIPTYVPVMAIIYLP